MFQPRNSLVVVELIQKAERQVGKLTIPTNGDLFCEAEVIAVGPGTQEALGHRPSTFDLRPGQRVLVKYQDVRQTGAQQYQKNKVGVEYRHGDRTYHLFDQLYVLAVLAEEVTAAGDHDEARARAALAFAAHN